MTIATGLSAWLFAVAPIAPGRITYEFARLRDFQHRELAIALVAGAFVASLAWVAFLYRRDSVELHPLLGGLLFLLRCVAWAGLLLFFLRLEKRTTREVTTNSQVVVLADVSQSMALPAGDDDSQLTGSRADQLVRACGDGQLLDMLRTTHDVSVVRFDQQVDRLTMLSKRSDDVGQPAADPTSESAGEPTNWEELLLPRGIESRLGDALQEQLAEFRDAPLAAVIMLTDGGQNAGIDVSTAAQLAQSEGVPVFTIGVGSTQPHRNVRLSDFVAPSRAFPGDLVTLTAYVQAHGLAGRLLDVELLRRPHGAEPTAATQVASERVVLESDGDIVAVPFEIEPLDIGRFVYQTRLAAPADDNNSQDNSQEAEIDVVDRQTRVLLFAGGPARDYRFLRNLLYRDPSVQVDVLLQTAMPGAAQEADRILQEFPSSKVELYEYDCLVAIDPDWTQLDALQLELIDSWIGAEAGGMIVTAGPIHTARWLRSTEHAQLKNIYPVEFQERLTLLDDGHYTGATPWPIQFERAGREARFLWLDNTAALNAVAWESFPGVYGYYAAKQPKRGSTVYGRFSDPQAGIGDDRPVYLASHLYGAGRVFYLGSAELWRLRVADTAYFDRLYTQLIRHVSQGRLLRGSSRGALLVERDRYELGETVVVRARLTDEQFNPLLIPSVNVQVVRPAGDTQSVKLVADENQPGMYAGQFTVLSEGAFLIALTAAGGLEEPLNRRIQVRIPDLERSRPQRDATLLSRVAKLSGGRYYPELDTAIRGDADVPPLARQIADRTEIKLIEGAPDEDFDRRQMHWLLGIVCGALLTEWTTRRLLRLA